MTKKTESVVLGGGCFWCLEAAYQLVNGVSSVIPGYAGGTTKNPSYEQVMTGTTAHVEVVRVSFDPAVIGLERILAVFWTIHNPTSLNAQGADVGTEYASVIFYEVAAHLRVINDSLRSAQSQLDQPIVTRIEPLDTFYEAERYHHDYYRNNPLSGYCRVVIDPKLAKLRQHFAPLLTP